ncbi:glycosyltransferase family 4 protein [Parvularcula sp. IMCC14364]|uniref:glycosyltransferase family 4 protein n=1 Tax=Parvularcula sp. IMCC14364 TaxID=3067902 RepID=UPI002740FE65|nr:glycosyltransferase family 4 protein [Parvularcula sp. IMCC14364]
MKILYSHRTRSADGQYVHIEALTQALAAEGCDLTICSPDGIEDFSRSPGRKMDAGAGEGSGLKTVLPKFAYEVLELAYSVPAWWRLRRAARLAKPDFIYERYNLFFLAGLWLKKQTGLPLILEVNAPLREERQKHGGLALGWLAAWAERKVWRGADMLLPVTQALAQTLIETGIDPKKIRVMPNGIHADQYEHVDGEAIKLRYNLHGKIVLGFTGFVRDWHGVDMILEYLSTRDDPDLHCLIVGDGPHLPHLKEKVLKLSIEKQVTFTGVVQRSDLPAFVASFDIALQPRVTAYASPLKLFEYMAAGKAIVAPAQSNIQEVLKDGEDALLFAPDSETSLFAALDRLNTDQALRDTLGEAARQKIHDGDMTWAGNARKVIEIARALTSSREIR